MLKEGYVADGIDFYQYRKATLDRVIVAIPFVENYIAYHNGVFAMVDSDVEKLLNI